MYTLEGGPPQKLIGKIIMYQTVVCYERLNLKKKKKVSNIICELAQAQTCPSPNSGGDIL